MVVLDGIPWVVMSAEKAHTDVPVRCGMLFADAFLSHILCTVIVFVCMFEWYFLCVSFSLNVCVGNFLGVLYFFFHCV